MLLWLQNMGGAGGSYNVGHFDGAPSAFYEALWKRLREAEIKKRSALDELKKELKRAKRKETVAKKAIVKASQATEKPISKRYDESMLIEAQNALEARLRIQAQIREVEREIDLAIKNEVKRKIKDDEDAIVAILAAI